MNKVTVKINGKVESIPKYTTILELLEEQGIKYFPHCYAALVNNELVSLSYVLHADVEIKLLDYTHTLGVSVYKRSVSFLLARALFEMQRNTRLAINHSMGNACYYDLFTDAPVTDELLSNIENKMNEIARRNEPIKRKTFTVEKAKAFFTQRAYTDKVRLLEHMNKDDKVGIYSCGKFYDLDYGPLVASTGFITHFELKTYGQGFLLLFPNEQHFPQIAELQDMPKVFHVFQESKRWGKILQVNNVGKLNEFIVKDDYRELIYISEALHEKKIAEIADNIAEHKNTKLVLIAGPSSSGKTTFSQWLRIHLRVNGLRPVVLSLDNYYIDRDKSPRNPDGSYNFEAIECLDLEFFNANVIDLLKGKEVELPKYSFKEGRRKSNGTKLRIFEDQLLIVEGIHGLNEKLTFAVPAEAKYKIFISALTQITIDDHNRISTTDSRLIRRIVRDHQFRAYSAQNTIKAWPSVRRGEELYIFPFQEEADIMFNSALLYELAVLKPYVLPLLAEIKQESDEYSHAKRLMDFLKLFKDIPSDEVPNTSLLKEFIG